MFRKKRWISTFSLIWAVLQFALPTGASYLDAAAASRPSASASVVHIEEGPGKSCQPPHSAECAVCRYLSSCSGDAPQQAPVQITTRATHLSPARVLSHGMGGIDALPLSRAPPPV